MDSNRQDEIRAMHRKYRLFYQLLGGGVILVVGILIGASFFADKDGYAMNVVTEGFGVAVSVLITVLVIDRWYAHRDRENLKRSLVRQVSSESNEFAKNAVNELRNEGWLQGDEGLLKERYLRLANLQGANLTEANLEKTDLTGANLKKADLIRANLQEARLNEANLEQAKLPGANLCEAYLNEVDMRKANLSETNLQGAYLYRSKLHEANLVGADLRNSKLCSAELEDATMIGVQLQDADLTEASLRGVDLGWVNLRRAKLQGAYLQQAKLIGANLRGAILLSAKLDGAVLNQATLPDGTTYGDETDMERFTDCEHPEFNATVDRINDFRRELRCEPFADS